MRLIAEISMGAGTLAMIGGTVVIVGFLTLGRGWHAGRSGLLVAGQHRHRGADRIPGGVHQCAHRGAGGGGHRFGGHVRRRCDRAAGRDADQRGDRRAGVDGHPAHRISGVDPPGGRDGRDHAAVLDRGDPVVRRQPVHHGGVVRPVRRTVRPLFRHVPEPDRPAVVVPSGGADGDHDPVDPHVLRLLRHRRPIGCRCRGRQRGAHLAGRGRVGDAAGLVGRFTVPTATSTCRVRGPRR